MSATHRPDPMMLSVECEDARLAGSLWAPEHEPPAVVLMWPGSGPSDRHNDVYFPPIREQFLSLGLAVCSFDKRGVGDSTGSWLIAGIDVQADDALACVEHVSALLPGVPVGLFGHSQGGWVVIEAAAKRPDIALLIVNSGPGVSPAAQERYATMARLVDQAHSIEEFADALRCFDLVLTCMSAGAAFASTAARVERAGLTHVYRRPDLFSFPLDDSDVWAYATIIIDHDPTPAMRSLAVPTLAVFGAHDHVVPVDSSVAAYESYVAPELLTVAVLPDGDHRIQRDGQLVDGYFDTLSAFVRSAVTR